MSLPAAYISAATTTARILRIDGNTSDASRARVLFANGHFRHDAAGRDNPRWGASEFFLNGHNWYKMTLTGPLAASGDRTTTKSERGGTMDAISRATVFRFEAFR